MPQEIITEHYSQSFNEMDPMTNSKSTPGGEKPQLLHIKTEVSYYSMYTILISYLKKPAVFSQNSA